MTAASALIVPVPAAESLVAGFRQAHDPSAKLGIPAHITVLYPFLATARLDEGSLERLLSIVAGHHAFSFRLEAVRQFPGGVLYLAPEPSHPFTALTEAVYEEWPESPPYRNAHATVVPHLTVADLSWTDIRAGDSKDLFEDLTPVVESGLPVETVADEVMLYLETPDRWVAGERFPLG